MFYLRDLSSIVKASAFFNSWNVTNLVINNTTPPTIEDVDIDATRIHVSSLYVPDEAVESYKSAPGWQLIESRIKPLSELPSVETRAEYDVLSDTNKQNTIIKEYM